MKYCTRCVLPDTHESIKFDEEGVCNICRQAEKKHTDIDWDARRKMLDDICDCIVVRISTTALFPSLEVKILL